MRRLDAKGLEALKMWEHFVPYAYDDADPKTPKYKIRELSEVRGVLTIGYGHTGPDVYPGLEIDDKVAEELLRADLAQYEQAVERSVVVPLTNNQFTALVSFAFNVGVAAFRSSTLLKKLNAGDFSAVQPELARWNKTRINGKLVVSQGLKNRRAMEAAVWGLDTPVAPSATPVETVKDWLGVAGSILALVKQFR